MNSPVIFLAEKNPIHASLIKYHLHISRFLQVQIFPNGEELLYRMRKGVLPDFVISDYDVGSYTGFDFLEKVKALSEGSHVVFFSTYEDPILAMRLLEAGASDYISKTGKLELGIAELVKNIRYLSGIEVRQTN